MQPPMAYCAKSFPAAAPTDSISADAVSQNSNGAWQYTITKSGSSNSVEQFRYFILILRSPGSFSKMRMGIGNTKSRNLGTRTRSNYLISSLVSHSRPRKKQKECHHRDNTCEILDRCGLAPYYGKLKIGSARGDIERYFSREGGFQVPASTRYVYSRCEYLHVEIDFELAKPAEIAFSTTDKITKISKLYVEYPSKD